VGGGAETMIMKNQNGVVIELNSTTQGASLKPVTMPRIKPCYSQCSLRWTAHSRSSPTIEKGVPQMEGQSKTTSSEIAWAVVAMTVLAFMLWINQ
jgi:hypothetical protein